MEEMQIVIVGLFFTNDACKDYKKADRGNMIKIGKTDIRHGFPSKTVPPSD
jgi:hypothetical protein